MTLEFHRPDFSLFQIFAAPCTHHAFAHNTIFTLSLILFFFTKIYIYKLVAIAFECMYIFNFYWQ